MLKIVAQAQTSDKSAHEKTRAAKRVLSAMRYVPATYVSSVDGSRARNGGTEAAVVAIGREKCDRHGGEPRRTSAVQIRGARRVETAHGSDEDIRPSVPVGVAETRRR